MRDVKVYLSDIFESISAIEEYVEGLTEEDFYSNRQVQDAVIRRLEIIGEAVKNIDEDFRERHPDIPWKKVAGLRDVLIHEYSGVKIERVWNVVKRDLLALKQEVSLLMEKY